MEVVEDGEDWLLTDGESRMLVFGTFEAAKKARDVVQHYGFTRHCFVGRPDPPRTYWLAEA